MSEDKLIGKQLDEYRLEELLGQGGMARVYRGLDVKLKRHVAIKVIDSPFRADSDYTMRFEREAQAIGQLEHPNVVRLYRYGEVDGLLYMAMEYIEGADLHYVLDDYRGDGEFIEFEEANKIIRQVCEALDYSHELGIIHRDIKPANILLDKSGRAVLSDFGLVLLTEIGTRGEIFGSPHYIAPEQAISSAGVVPQTDQYAVGVILYEMFTGELPFDAEDALDLAAMHMSEPPPPPCSIRPEIPARVEEIILKAMAKEPADRYETCTQLADALDEALRPAREQISAPPPSLHHMTIVDRVGIKLDENPLPPLPAAVTPPPKPPSALRPARPASLPQREERPASTPKPPPKAKPTPQPVPSELPPAETLTPKPPTEMRPARPASQLERPESAPKPKPQPVKAKAEPLPPPKSRTKDKPGKQKQSAALPIGALIGIAGLFLIGIIILLAVFVLPKLLSGSDTEVAEATASSEIVVVGTPVVPDLGATSDLVATTAPAGDTSTEAPAATGSPPGNDAAALPTGPTAIPGGQPVTLLYGQGAFFLWNNSDSPVYTSRLAFEALDSASDQSAGYFYEGWQWDEINRSGQVTPGRCVVLVNIDQPSNVSRSECEGVGNPYLAVRNTGSSFKPEWQFWLTGDGREHILQFRVLWRNDAGHDYYELARCEIAAGTCEIYLPP